MIIHSKAVEQFFTVALFFCQFYPGCDFEQFVNFGLDNVRSERVKLHTIPTFIVCDIPVACEPNGLFGC